MNGKYLVLNSKDKEIWKDAATFCENITKLSEANLTFLEGFITGIEFTRDASKKDIGSNHHDDPNTLKK